MARLPADGESVQSRSSGSIQITSSTPLALAVEATTGTTQFVENMKQDGGQEEEGQLHAGSQVATPLDDPPDNRTTAAAVDAHEDKGGCTVDEEGQEVENSTNLPPVEGVSCTEHADDTTGATLTDVAIDAIHTAEVAQSYPQEAFPTVKPEFENAAAVHTDGAREGKAEGIDGPTTLHTSDEEAKLSETEGGGEVPRTKFEEHFQASTTTFTCIDDTLESRPAVETREIEALSQPFVKGEAKSELVGVNTETGMVAECEAVTDVETAKELEGGQALAGQGKEDEEESSIVKSPSLDQDEEHTLEIDGARDSEANPEQEDVFFSSESFTGARLGYVFKTGDKGLGFYVEGYVSQSTRGNPVSSHRPWNAGPGEEAIRRGPLGPIPQPFKKIVPYRTRKEKKAAEESDM